MFLACPQDSSFPVSSKHAAREFPKKALFFLLNGGILEILVAKVLG